MKWGAKHSPLPVNMWSQGSLGRGVCMPGEVKILMKPPKSLHFRFCSERPLRLVIAWRVPRLEKMEESASHHWETEGINCWWHSDSRGKAWDYEIEVQVSNDNGEIWCPQSCSQRTSIINLRCSYVIDFVETWDFARRAPRLEKMEESASHH